MATPPTFVAEYEAASWITSGATKTASVTVANGDTLVVIAATEGNSDTLATPSGGGLTYTLAQSIVVSAFASCYIWTAPSASGQTFTITLTHTGVGFFGFNALRFSGATVGTSTKTNVTGPSAPSLAITTTADNSTIVMANSDWSAADGVSRVYRTINSITPAAGGSGEVTYARDAATYAAYGAYWSDAGATGAKTVGLTAPSQKFSIIALELKGAVAAAAVPVFRPRLTQAVAKAAQW